MPKSDSSLDQMIHLNDRIEASMLKRRRIFLADAVDSDSAAQIIRKLWFLEAESPKTPITLFINSPGGSVDAGFAIWDQIQMISSQVTTVVTGLAASMASVLSLAAAPKRRFATPQARIMVHQPRLSGVIQGQATDLEIQAKEMLKTRSILVDIYVKSTGKSAEEIEKAIDRDTWMTAEEALKFNLIDKIISHDEQLG